MPKDRVEWKRWLFWFVFAVAIILVYKVLDNLGDITMWLKNLLAVMMPFIMALLIAYLFYLPCRKVESIIAKSKSKFLRKKARWISILTVYIIAILIVIIIVKFIVPTVYESLLELVAALPGYYNTMVDKLKELPEDSIVNKINLTATIKNLGEINLADYLNLERIGEYAKGIIGIATTIFDVFVTLVISIYLLAERGQILEFTKRLCGAIFNNNAYKTIGKYFRKSNEIFFKFVSSQMLDAIIVGILTSIAMSILGVKYAVLLGFMIGLFNLIPYLGAIIAIVLAIMITIFTGGITQAIWMTIVVIILQQIDANIINPKIIGNSLEISPILIIFSVTVIGSYFGIMGMFLAVPIVAIIKLIINDFIQYKESSKKIINEEIE